MAEFVNKVKKNGNEWEIRDARIASVDELKADIAGNSLVIPESSQPQPKPVATIDGVDYYHKCEFDLNELLVVENELKYTSVLDFNLSESAPENAVFHIVHSYGPTGTQVIIANSSTSYPATLITKTSDGFYINDADYINHAYEAVDNIEDSNIRSLKIFLPTCSKFYLAFDIDTGILTSYFNLNGEESSVPEFVDSVKQGNSVIPLYGKDVRLPAAEQADAGKVLKVAAAGGYILGNAGGGSDSPIQVIDFSIHSGNTFNDLASTLGFNVTAGSEGSALFLINDDNKYYTFSYRYQKYGSTGFTIMEFGTSGMIRYYSTDKDAYITSNSEVSPFVPKLPSDASSKTYALEAVNGTLQWVEKTA